MAELIIRLHFAGRSFPTVLRLGSLELPALEQIEVAVGDQPEDVVMRAPFYFHGHMIHTVCRRLGEPEPDRVDQVTW
jgi:hypothetical protein